MAVPKRRTSKARRRKRFATWSEVTTVAVVRCKNCNGKHRPHVACPYCGYYKGREVMKARIEPAE